MPFLTLASGQRVALGEYGAPDGAPVFFFHGWPASQYQASLIDEPSRELGLRIVSLDRPGVGASDPQPGRRLLDWPPLLAEVADLLGIGTFRVLGVSGGGPYAFASAWALPDRIEVASVVCSAPPLAEPEMARGLMPVYRALLWAYRAWPWLLRRMFRAARPLAFAPTPPWAVALVLRAFPPADVKLMSDPVIGSHCLANFRGAWTGSADGVFDDAAIYSRPWEFPLAEIRVPVRLWHGREDRNFSWKLAEAIARRLPKCEAHFVEGEGHYSLPIGRSREILRDLRDSVAVGKVALA